MPEFNIVKCQYDEEWDRGVAYKLGKGNHKKVWRIVVDNDDVGGAEVLQKAIEGPLPAESDPIPNFGDVYTFNDFTDDFAYASDYDCKLEDPKAPNIFIAEVSFEAPGEGKSSKEDRERRTKPNPLDWDPIYYTEEVEDDEVVEEATLLESGRFSNEDPGITDPVSEVIGDKFWSPTLASFYSGFPNIKRGFAFGGGTHEPGPVINTAGQQTIDPVTETVFHPILVCERNYPNAFQAIEMNRIFGRKVNSQYFLGDPPRTWRYTIARAEKPQEKEITVDPSDSDSPTKEIITYYPTIVKLEYNKNTWDRFILNNGQSCFRYGYNQNIPVPDPRDDTGLTPMLFPVIVMQLKEEVEEYVTGSNTYEVTMDDLEPVVASEPVNLADDGRPIHEVFVPGHPDFKKALHLRYRHYKEEDFNLIPAFLELVEQYEDFVGGP